MKNIFTGFLLIFLDFNLDLGASRIGLIPDFIGYIIMISGLKEMAEESPLFLKAKPFAAGMAIYTGILYFMDMFAISASLGAFTYVLGITSTIISLYISYKIIMGVRDMEEKYNTPLNGDSLKSVWTALVLFNILTFVLLLLPPLAIVSILISLIAAICFLVAFNRSKNLYYQMKDPWP